VLKSKFKENQSDKLIQFVTDLYTGFNVSNHYSKTIENSIQFSYFVLIELFKRDKYKDKSYRFLLVPHSAEFYTDFDRFSYRAVKLAIKVLTSYNIISVKKGFRKYKQNYIEPDFVEFTWEQVESKLTKLTLQPLSEWNVKKSIFELTGILAPKFNKCSTVHRLKNKLKIKTEWKAEINIQEKTDFINKFLIEKGYPEFQYQRIFGSTNKSYGRFYNIFQQINKEKRQQILDQNGWVILDFKSFNPSLLYMLETGNYYSGIDIYNDVLQDLQYSTLFRPVIKQSLNAMLATKSKEHARKAVQKILNDSGYHYQLNALVIINSIEKVHNKISSYFYSDCSAFTQFSESTIIYNLMLEQIKYGILPLSIHDSIIVPKQYKELFENLMIKYFLEYVRTSKNFISKNILYINTLIYKKYLIIRNIIKKLNLNIIYNNIFIPITDPPYFYIELFILNDKLRNVKFKPPDG
jgi:hypothetical protein